MQGDIRQPGARRRKLTPKLKSLRAKAAEPPVDMVLDETAFDDARPKAQLFGKTHHHFLRLRDFWSRLNRWEKSVVLLGTLLVLGAGGVGWAFFHQAKPAPLPPPPKVQPKPQPPLTVASPLTGLPVDPALTKRPVTGIMIENSVFARPQSGLQDAGVVYEAVAEGGITRFLTLFQDAQPQYIGPVRSLRPYYIDFAAPFQASIVHVGGSPEALSRVRDGSYRDLDQFFNSGSFMRVGSRPAPHNLYTSFAKLDALNQSKGYSNSLFTSWPRKTEQKQATPTAKTIDFLISGPDYYAHYDYDQASNSYMRSEGGAVHKDLVSADDKSGVQLHPKVVIALIMAYSIAADGQHSVYADTGSGQAYVFQDGGVMIGSWEKADAGSQIDFKDSAGAPIKLNAGQTWLTLVGSSSKVSYKP